MRAAGSPFSIPKDLKYFLKNATESLAGRLTLCSCLMIGQRLTESLPDGLSAKRGVLSLRGESGTGTITL